MMQDLADDWQFLCNAEELSHAQCLEFDIVVDGRQGQQAQSGFVLCWCEEYFAYLNSCPHTKVSMNWAPNQFFDIEHQLLQCGLHGALFEPASGLCIRGPCLGQSLTALPVKLENGQIFAKKGL